MRQKNVGCRTKIRVSLRDSYSKCTQHRRHFTTNPHVNHHYHTPTLPKPHHTPSYTTHHTSYTTYHTRYTTHHTHHPVPHTHHPEHQREDGGGQQGGGAGGQQVTIPPNPTNHTHIKTHQPTKPSRPLINQIYITCKTPQGAGNGRDE